MCWSAYGKDRLGLFQNLTEVLEPLLLNVLGLAAKYRKSQFYWRGHVPPTCEAAGPGERPVGSARHTDNGQSAGADLPRPLDLRNSAFPPCPPLTFPLARRGSRHPEGADAPARGRPGR